MQALVYYLSLPFIYLLAIMPFWVLYGVSDGLFLLLYYVIGYRKKVVRTNLLNAFPDKTSEERLAIEKKYFQYLCDLILETIKRLTISPEEAVKRCTFDDASLLQKHEKFILVMGHWGNWEWAGNSVAVLSEKPLYVVYKPLSNNYFEKLLVHMRTRLGLRLIPVKTVLREMLRLKDEPNITAFLADQTPQPKDAYWTNFLNQQTPVFMGTEKIARKLGYPIIYGNVRRLRRGFYEAKIEMLCENPYATNDGEISEIHTRRLEKDILSQPEIWLWSHRRWKHKLPV